MVVTNLAINGSRKRVLVISPQPFFATRGTPINVRAMVTVLAESGFDVDLLTYPIGQEIELPHVEIIRCANPLRFQSVTIGPSSRKLVLDVFMLTKAVRLCKTRRYDIIHGIEEGGMIACLVGKLFEVPFIYDVDSDIAHELKARHFLSLPPLLWIVRRLEQASLIRAAAVITVCPALTEKVRQSLPDQPVYEIPDTPLDGSKDVDPVMVERIRRELRLEGSRVILYTGNLQDYQGIPLLIEAFAQLQRSPVDYGSLKLLIVGGAPEETDLMQSSGSLAAELGIDEHVTILNQQPIEQMGTYLSLADVLVSPRSRGENTPLKIYSYMAAGRPIVATRIRSHTQVLDESIAYLGDPTPAGLAEALGAALDDRNESARELRDQKTQRAATLASSRYSRAAFRARVQGCYFSIAGVTGRTAAATTHQPGPRVVRRPEALVTGAAGFVGTHMVRYLLEQGIAVRALVRTDEQAAQLSALGCEAVVGDITDRSSLTPAMAGIRHVYHIASLFRRAGLPDSVFRETNVEGTRNIFEAAIHAGVERVVHCSTVGVHGDIKDAPASEQAPYAPGDIYQQTKMEGELVALDYFKSGRMKGVVIRPAMIYGPGDTRTLKLFKRVAQGAFVYVGPGDSLVHFIDVRDLVHAFHLAMGAAGRSGDVYIIAGRESQPLKSMVEKIAGYFGVAPPRLHLPIRPVQLAGTVCEAVCRPFGIQPPIFRRRVDFFTKNRSFTSRKAREELGFIPKRSFDEEIADICSWYVEHGYIAPKRGKRHATIIRDLNGNIVFWDANAVRSYGWDAEQAVGSVSHTLLQTEFPAALTNINNELLKHKLWEGELIHTTKDGARIRVASRWQCVEHPEHGLRILERNHRVASDNRDDEDTGTLRSKMGGAVLLVSEWTQVLPELMFAA